MTLVWDETGARYFETGVSKGIFFPISGAIGVPWNGLVSVNLDPQGGESEHYYFDGIKYMDRVLAEDFQATIQAISTPDEFAAAEGDRAYAPGVMTSFNKRDKFHMSWRTEIGNDEGQAVAYKIHIAYNNLVQPSSREWQTVTDSSQMNPRTFVISATPACGRNSYFWFDSRKWDLSLLEAQLTLGILPKCWELKDLVQPPGGGGGGVDPIGDEGCINLLSDLEIYNHGEEVTDTINVTDVSQITVTGLINNGLDIIELPAVGAFAANDSAASEVGTGDILADDDDATYITSADGDLGYTVGLPPLVGYVEGCQLELHIRAAISGGVNPDDPDNMDADMQVHISTDADGDLTIGGFSDGTDEGMGFSLAAVDGTILDYVIPLRMDAWVDTTLDDVVTALEAGAYLNVVSANNNNFDTTPEVDVYEAKVVMLNDTDPDKWLRTTAPDTEGNIELHAYAGGTDNQVVANSVYVDFKLREVANVDGGDDHTNVISWAHLTEEPALVQVQMYNDGPYLEWYSGTGGTEWAFVKIETNVWYTAVVDWNSDSIRIRAYPRDNDDLSAYIMDDTRDLTIDPVASAGYFAGMATYTTNTVEVVIDNARLQVHCNGDLAPESWIAWPDSVTFSGPDSYLSGVDGGIGMDIFRDDADLGFAEMPRPETGEFNFTTHKGPGGLSASELSIVLHTQANHGDGINPGEHRVHIDAFSSGSDPVFAVWEGSIPDTSVVYNDGLPVGPKVGGVLGSITELGTDHWWTFQNHTSASWTTDGTDNDDPWPALTDALAAGELVVRVQYVSTGGGDFYTPYCRVFEFTIGPA